MRPPIGFMGPGHQTPACFPTADARIPSLSSPLVRRNVFFVSVEKNSGSAGIETGPVHRTGPVALCDMQYFHLHISPNYANIAFVTSFYHNVFLKRGDRI